MVGSTRKKVSVKKASKKTPVKKAAPKKPAKREPTPAAYSKK